MTRRFGGRNRTAGVGALALVTAAAGFAFGIGPAGAAAVDRYVATTGSDGSGETPNDCTVPTSPCRHVQYAVGQANAGDTIHVKAGTYDESVRIRKSLTLVGDGVTGSGKTLIDGDGSGPSIFVDGLDVNTATVVTIRDLAVDGNASDDGVDLAGLSTATIENSTVSHNARAGVNGNGQQDAERVAAAADTGTHLTISGSDVSDNAAGGIQTDDTMVAVDHSTIDRNGQGGVVLNNGSTATIDTTTLDANFGAGVVVNGPGNAASIHASTISNTKQFTVDEAAAQRYGGGVLVFAGTADIRTSTIDGNTGQGVLSLGSAVTIANSTITGTKQPAGETGTSGGSEPPLPYGDVAVENVVVPRVRRAMSSSYPDGGASGAKSRRLAALPAAPSTTLVGTIVGNGGTKLECNGAVVDDGYNLSTDSGNSCNFSTAKHDRAKTDPKLGPLAANGGPTKTELLRKGSPAIDAIPGGQANCVATASDQRGIARPQPTGNACDVGAVELKARTIVIHPDSLPNGTVGEAYHATITATGGAYPTYAFSLAPGSSALPDGLTMDAHGHITGTPSKVGTFPFTVSVNDPVLKDYTIVIEGAAPNAASTAPIAATGAPVVSMTALGAGAVFAGFLMLVGAGVVGRRPGRHRARG